MRNPKGCKWAQNFHGIYICRGNCLPCEMVKNEHCEMEEEYFSIKIEKASKKVDKDEG